MPTGVHKWYREQLARRKAEAELNLARVKATLRQMGINALNASPEQLAEAKLWAAETRASFAKFRVISFQTWGEYRAEETHDWVTWERTHRLSVQGHYDLDDPC